MSIPKELPCHLAQDLLIPYVAGDVSVETKQWLDEHLSTCSTCRTAYEATHRTADAVATPTPAPKGDPGRRLLGRMRRNIFVVIAVVLAAVGLGGGALFWGIGAMRNLAGMPAYHPAPVSGITPLEVMEKLDLSDLHLRKESGGENDLIILIDRPAGLQPSNANFQLVQGIPGSLPGRSLPGSQSSALFWTDDGEKITVTAVRGETPAVAKESYKRQMDTHVQVGLVQFDRPDESVFRMRSGGFYEYAWWRGNWYFTIRVPGTTPQPEKLRDQVRDRLISTIEAMNQAKGQ